MAENPQQVSHWRHRFFAGAAVLLWVVGFGLPVWQITKLGLTQSSTGFFEVFYDSRTWQVLWFTVWSASLATLISVLCGLPLAYLLYRVELPGARWLQALVLVPFVLPTVVVGVAIRQLLQKSGWLGWLGWDGSWQAIILGLVFFNLPVVVRGVGAAWAELDYRPLAAAAGLGATPVQVFWTVLLPQLAPSIRSAASIVFLFCATSFGVVQLLGNLSYSNLETEIFYLTTAELDLNSAAGLGLLQLCIVLGLLFWQRRKKISFAHRVPLVKRPYRWGWLTTSGWLVLLGLGLPLASLVISSLQTSTGLGFANFGNLPVEFWQAMANSLQIMVVAAGVSVGLGLLICYLVVRTGWGWLDRLFLVPLGISAATLGFGYLITFNRPPLLWLGSGWLVPLVQALLALPVIVRILLPVWQSISVRQQQIAVSLGAKPWQVFYSVEWPVLRPVILAAAGFTAAISLGEFGATSFLVREDTLTLPIYIGRLFSRPGVENYQGAIAAAICLAGLVVSLVLVSARLTKGRHESFT